ARLHAGGFDELHRQGTLLQRLRALQSAALHAPLTRAAQHGAGMPEVRAQIRRDRLRFEGPLSLRERIPHRLLTSLRVFQKRVPHPAAFHDLVRRA
ncbi:MAG: hypothetical protein ACK56I_22920, partial [bacterium]